MDDKRIGDLYSCSEGEAVAVAIREKYGVGE